MNNINLIGALILAVSSGMLIGYSGIAKTRGMVQGTFFASQKASLLGLILLVLSLIIAFTTSGIIGVVFALLAAWLIPGLLISSLGSSSQIIALLMAPIGLLIGLF